MDPITYLCHWLLWAELTGVLVQNISLHAPPLRATDLGSRPLSHVRKSSCWPHCLCYLCSPLLLIAPINIQNRRHLMWETLLFIVWLYQSAHSQRLEPNQSQLFFVDNLKARKKCYIFSCWEEKLRIILHDMQKSYGIPISISINRISLGTHSLGTSFT